MSSVPDAPDQRSAAGWLGGRSRPCLPALLRILLQILVDENNRHPALADRGGDALERVQLHVPAGKDRAAWLLRDRRRRAATVMLSAQHGAHNLVLLIEQVPAEFHRAARRVLLRWGLIEHG